MRVEASIARRLPDGRYELELPSGRRYRTELRPCPKCKTPTPDNGWGGMGDVCVACATAKAREPEERRQKHIRDLRAAGYEAVTHRVKDCRRATPKWADRKAIKEVYIEAARLTMQTGILHEADHIWPLKHPKCCGLHVHWNLRPLPARENARKGNRLPCDDPPRCNTKDSTGVTPSDLCQIGLRQRSQRSAR